MGGVPLNGIRYITYQNLEWQYTLDYEIEEVLDEKLWEHNTSETNFSSYNTMWDWNKIVFYNECKMKRVDHHDYKDIMIREYEIIGLEWLWWKNER